MLRGLLLGLCVVSASACSKSSGESAPKVQPGVAAGKVLEVKGTVSVKHGDATKPLAVGDAVEGSDTVVTGADGNVVIELAHNSARWELGPNKQQKVSESIAWKATKATAQDVDQATAAAGRPAERSAAGTVATADEGEAEEAKKEEAAPAPAAAAPAPAAAPEPAVGGAGDMQPKGGEAPAPPRERTRRRTATASASKGAAPEPEAAMAPPPPPPPPPADDSADEGAVRHTRGPMPKAAAAPPPGGEGLGAVGTASGGGGNATASASKTTMRVAPTAQGILTAKTPNLQQCMKAANMKDEVTLTVDVVDGKATAKITSKGSVAGALDKCMKAVVAKTSFTGTSKATLVLKP